MTKAVRSRMLISVFLFVLVCACLCAVLVTKAEAADASGSFVFSDCRAQTGKTASVTVSIKNNPGVGVASIKLIYDDTALTLRDVENGEVFPSLDVGVNLFWSADADCKGDGLLATLTFDISEDAEDGDYIISARVNEAFNEGGSNVELAVLDGKITVFNFIYGDVNGDLGINALDVLVIRKYMADFDYNTGTSSVEVLPGADANGDGNINALDVLVLRKYMANYDYDTGSSSIVLGPPSVVPPVTTPPVTTQTPVTTAPIEEVTPEYVMATAPEVALEYIAWQAAINGEAVYFENEDRTVFTYDGTEYAFSGLKPVQIDVYSYDRIERVTKFMTSAEELFATDELDSLRVKVSDDDGTLEVALTSIIDYCADMIYEFHSIMNMLYNHVMSVKTQYPLLSPYNSSPSNKWKSSSGVTVDTMLEFAMYGRSSDEYTQISSSVSSVLSSTKYKGKSLVGYGIKNGTTASGIVIWANSFQGAVYSVDPLNYAVRSTSGTITGFDSAMYKADLDAAINTAYVNFRAAYVKDTNNSSDFTAITNKITAAALDYGLWTVEGEFILDGEAYTYAVNSTGKAAAFNLYDSLGEKVTSDISLNIDGVDYEVAFAPEYDYDNGKVYIVPTLTSGILPAHKKDIYDLLGLKTSDFVYDIRDYVDEIGANFDSISDIPVLGQSYNYAMIALVNLQTIFGYEAQNDFYCAYETLRARIYAKNASGSWKSFGNYITSSAFSALDSSVKNSLNTLSKLARDTVSGYTAETNTLEDIEREFNSFAIKVKVILAENGYSYTTANVDGYEQIAAVGITASGGSSSATTPIDKILTLLETVESDAVDAALQYIAWQAAITDTDVTTFVYNGNSYTFRGLAPAQIDIYSYESIKKVINVLDRLGVLFADEGEAAVEILRALTVDIPDDDDELKISLSSIIDYCADMIYDFYSVASALHSSVENIRNAHPLTNAGIAHPSNRWKSSSSTNLVDVAMLNRITGINNAEYEQIKSAVSSVLGTATYKYKSTVGYGINYGTASGLTVWQYSYQGAIYSVDPIKYVIRNANDDDKIIGFDAAAYKAALNTAIATAYNAFLPKYVKDPANASCFDALMNRLTQTLLSYGLWTIEGDAVIGGETYTYTVSSKGKAIAFNVYDALGERVSGDITLNIDGVYYWVALVPSYDYINGKVYIVPTLTAGTLPAHKKDVYDLLGLKKADLTYDIRDYAEEIGANFDRAGAIHALGYTNVNYVRLTSEDLQRLFTYEAQNDFYATFETLRARVYIKNASGSWNRFGDYIPKTTFDALPGSLKDALNTVSKLARDYIQGMTSDANDISDVESEFNKFATRVKAILAENGYSYTTANVDGYEQITAVGITASGGSSSVTTPIDKILTLLETVESDAVDAALQYIAWQAAINREATYNADTDVTTFVYNGCSYTFNGLAPAQIDIYSYESIKNVINVLDRLGGLFADEGEAAVEILRALTVDIPDDDDELKISLSSIIDYCADMIYDFYSVASALHLSVENVRREHPLTNAGIAHSSNRWKSSSYINLVDVAMLNRITGTNKAEYEQIKGEVDAVLYTSTYKYRSTVGYGVNYGYVTASGLTVWQYSYQGAIYSVDPIKYVIRNANADDKIIGFDAASYKAALNTAIATAYNAFLPKYVKDPANASCFDALMNRLTQTLLKFGLWAIEGDAVIGGEAYTYTVNSTGIATAFNVYDALGEKVSGDITLKIDNVNYAVRLVPIYDYNNGKVTIEPTLTAGTLPTTKKDVYDLLGLKKADLTYDIRDYAEEIGANFDRAGWIPALGFTNVNYMRLTSEDLQKFFGYEIQNDFCATYETLRARVYVKNASGSWNRFGDYIPKTTFDALPGALKDALNTVSKLARDYIRGMTPDANDISDIESEFNKFATRVKSVLTENGYTYTTAVDASGYEVITSVTAYVAPDPVTTAAPSTTAPLTTQVPATTAPVTTVAPVTTQAPVVTEPVEVSYTIPYKADISMTLTDNGNGVYVADSVFGAANTYAFVEKGAGYAVGGAEDTNLVETRVSYAWDGEYIYAYVVAKDDTLLAIPEDIANDPDSNWAYDGFELWYHLGSAPASRSQLRQFWASRTEYFALNAQAQVKSVHFDDIEWTHAVSGNTTYLVFKIPARTEENVALVSGDKFYTAIQIDDRRSDSAFYCATYNASQLTQLTEYDEYTLGEVTTSSSEFELPKVEF